MCINTENRTDVMGTDFVASDLIPEVSHLPVTYTPHEISPVFSLYL